MDHELKKIEFPQVKEKGKSQLLNELRAHKHAAAAAIGTHNWSELETRAAQLKDLFKNSDLNIDEDATYYQGLSAVISYGSLLHHRYRSHWLVYCRGSFVSAQRIIKAGRQQTHVQLNKSLLESYRQGYDAVVWMQVCKRVYIIPSHSLILAS